MANEYYSKGIVQELVWKIHIEHKYANQNIKIEEKTEDHVQAIKKIYIYDL